MLKLFTHIRPTAIMYVILFGLLLRLPFLFLGTGKITHFNESEFPILDEIFRWNIYISMGIAFVLLILQAAVFNKICIEHDVIYTHTYLPAYFFVLINSLFFENLTLNSVVLGNTFVLIALSFMFRIYQSKEDSKQIFSAAFWMACAGFFIPEMVLSFLFIIPGILIFKTITLRDILTVFSGMFFPFLFFYGISYLYTGNVNISLFDNDVRIDFSNDWFQYTSFLVIMVLAVMGIGKGIVNYFKNKIKTRRIFSLQVLFLIFSGLICLVKYSHIKIYHVILVFSTCALISYFLVGSNQRKIKEFMNLMLIAVVVYSLYGGEILALIQKFK